MLIRKICSFLRLSLREKLWFFPAWVLLGVSRLSILLVSFRRLAPRLGVHHGAAAWIPLLSFAEEQRAAELGRVVALAARYTPWESNCFPQAITARLLLGWHRINYCIYFGVARERGDSGSVRLKAHAWVAAGRVRVCGRYSFDQFTVVGCFASHI
jgi:hypothetical protein